MAFDFAAIRDKSRDLFTAAKDRALELREQVRPHVDRAAEKAAKKVTDVTGRETTADEVKKAALVAAVGLSVVAIAASSGGAAAPMALGSAGSNSYGGGSGDVMDEAYGFFARNGSSLNIETHTVDMDGCILD